MTDQKTTMFYYSGPHSGLIPALKTALAQAGTLSGYEIREMFGRADRIGYAPEPGVDPLSEVAEVSPTLPGLAYEEVLF